MSAHRTPLCSSSNRSIGHRTDDLQRSGLRRSTVLLSATLLLTACATQVSSVVSTAPDTPGFLLGLWHGFIFPVAWVLSLFLPDVAVYAVPNNGGWYDFGYFLGIVVFGVGAKKGGERVVYRDRVIDTTARRID